MLSLDQVLAGLEVELQTLSLCVVHGDARLDLAALPSSTLHYVLSGRGRVHLDSGPPAPLRAGQIVIVPANRRQSVFGTPDDSGFGLPLCGPLPADWQQHEIGRGAGGLLLVCAALEARYRQAQGLFDHLAEPLVEELAPDDPLRATLATLLAELAAPQPGTAALVRSLLMQCLVHLLRRQCAAGDCRAPWLAALEDPRLGRALAAMVAHPEAEHRLDALAARAGMSRSSFALRFARTFGRSPIDLLKELRLQRAAKLLSSGPTPIKCLARRVGFESRSYFSRAFKQHYGVPPGRFRRRRQRR